MEQQKKKNEEEEEEEEVLVVVGFNNLPEGCISNILALTSPRDACRLSVVSSVFKSASESDELWERFLPSDYREYLLSSGSYTASSPPAAAGFPPSSSKKKELYLHLSDNPILIEEGKKSFQIDKETGKKCFMIGARELDITWGDTPEYWIWRSATGSSRFAEVAVLRHVHRFEILGKIDTRILSRNTTYAAYLVCNTNKPRGLDHYVSDASVKFVGGGGGGGACSGERAVCFSLEGSSKAKRLQDHLRRITQEGEQSLEMEVRFLVKRGDGRKEIELGDFYNDEGENGEIEMSIMEVKGNCPKYGLIVQGIEVRPKGSN